MTYKKLLLGVALLLSALTLFSCGKDSPAAETDTDTTAEAVETTVAETTVAATETEAETVPPTVATDKKQYRVGEPIYVTVTGNASDRLCFAPADFDLSSKKPIYYADLGGESTIPQGEPIALAELPGQNRSNPHVAFYYGVLPIGDYKAVVLSGSGEVLAETAIEIIYGKESVDTGVELAARCLDVALNYKTLYVNGCFGAPMTDKNKERYTQNTSYNKRPERTALINAASSDTFGFDCVCFIKGLLWGWDGDLEHVYGGAGYQANDVPDIGENSMIERSSDISTDFSAIEIGEAVWIDGHIGIYIGNGLAVECTPSWKDGVQVTACNASKRGFQLRQWTKHGKLPYVEYDGEYEDVRG